MNDATTAEIDRELASRAKEVAELATTLVEFDSHPGLEHVRRYAPTGVTAERWAVIEMSLDQLWNDLASATTILESAQAVRGRGSDLDDDRAELTRMLQYCDLGETLDRMRAACHGAGQFFDAVDEINTMVANGITPSLKQLDSAGAVAPKELAYLLAVSATDPLSLTAHEVGQRVAVIAELAALQVNWPEAVAATVLDLDALRDAVQHAAQTRAHAERTVATGCLPVPTDTEPDLRAELESIATPDPAALRLLQRRIESALQAVRHDEELAQGLLDRRGELQGRLRVYEAKAARLGLAEDADVLASRRIASGLLSRHPCDLRAVTRAIADYQQTVGVKREKAR
jgi:hypothetical protein